MTTLTLNLQPFVMTSEQFWELCQMNPELRLERTAKGKVIIMEPAGSETGSRNLSIGSQLWNWNDRYQMGIAFDSSSGFHLPNGADRAPDASWITQERWNTLTPKERRGFAPICPDFVIELRSPTDKLQDVREKMEEYIANGARLGWLIDPETRTVEIYEPGEVVETLYNPDRVSGEPVLPGFLMDMRKVWG